jgi:hypothetical protein
VGRVGLPLDHFRYLVPLRERVIDFVLVDQSRRVRQHRFVQERELTRGRSVVRKSKAITLSLLGPGITGFAIGCGGDKTTEPAPAPAPREANGTPAAPAEVEFEPDDTWHDKDGNPIAKEWVKGPDGKPVPAQHPHDPFGRPWVYDADGNLVLPPPVVLQPRRAIGSLWFVYVGPAGQSPGRVAPMPRGGLGSIGGRISSPGS